VIVDGDGISTVRPASSVNDTVAGSEGAGEFNTAGAGETDVSGAGEFDTAGTTGLDAAGGGATEPEAQAADRDMQNTSANRITKIFFIR